MGSPGRRVPRRLASPRGRPAGMGHGTAPPLGRDDRQLGPRRAAGDVVRHPGLPARLGGPGRSPSQAPAPQGPRLTVDLERLSLTLELYQLNVEAHKLKKEGEEGKPPTTI